LTFDDIKSRFKGILDDAHNGLPDLSQHLSLKLTTQCLEYAKAKIGATTSGNSVEPGKKVRGKFSNISKEVDSSVTRPFTRRSEFNALKTNVMQIGGDETLASASTLASTITPQQAPAKTKKTSQPRKKKPAEGKEKRGKRASKAKGKVETKMPQPCRTPNVMKLKAMHKTMLATHLGSGLKGFIYFISILFLFISFLNFD